MNAHNHSQIVSFIWSIAETLRDSYRRGKYRDVILPMTVIRRLDMVLEAGKAQVLETDKQLNAKGISHKEPKLKKAAGQAFYNTSRFCLRDLRRESAGAASLQLNFQNYLKGFSDNVQEIINKFHFYDEIKKLSDANLLGAVLEKFTAAHIDLSPETLDNHAMGTVFEELIRRFNRDNNEEAGEHWTPRDVVTLMADLIFVPIADQIQSASYTCYDGACGTGGMLTLAQDRLETLAEDQGKKVSIHLSGQEINPETYAIAKADLLLKGDGNQADNIRFGSTLSADGHAGRRFDFMLSNPPYGKDWNTDQNTMGGKKGISDPRFNATAEDGSALAMIPRSSDGQLLFLLNNVAKMVEDTAIGSRIAEVHNGSSLFTGDAGSGESNARRYLIERDLVEAIIQLPENMFYNTGISTYIWLLSNRKTPARQGKIQLIDASGMKEPLHQNMGKKNCEFSEAIRDEILRLFIDMEESEVSKILPNAAFGYWNVTVERPLRLRLKDNPHIADTLLRKAEEQAAAAAALERAPARQDWADFAAQSGLAKSLLKKIRPQVTERDETAKPLPEADPALRDSENIPFTYPGGIDAFIAREVKPYAPDAYLDPKKTRIGYEISFTQHFYRPAELHDMQDIIRQLKDLEAQADGMMHDILADLT